MVWKTELLAQFCSSNLENAGEDADEREDEEEAGEGTGEEAEDS